MRKTKRYRACSLSWEKAQRARLRRARSAARWLESVLVRQKRPAPARRPSSSVHGRAPTCQPRPPTSSRRSRVNTCERATACSLSRKEARHARLRCARAAPRWLASFFALWKPTTAAIQFSPSVHGRAPTCQSRPPTSSRRPRVRTHHRTITPTLSGGGAPRTLAMRARDAALVGVGPAVTEASYSSETSLSFGARPCSDVPAAASNEQPALACAHTPTHLRTYSLSEEGAPRALTMLARGAELIGLGPGSIEANYSSETALSLGARPCSDVPAAASNKQQAFARAHMRTRHCALSLSGGGAARALAV